MFTRVRRHFGLDFGFRKKAPRSSRLVLGVRSHGWTGLKIGGNRPKGLSRLKGMETHWIVIYRCGNTDHSPQVLSRLKGIETIRRRYRKFSKDTLI